MKRQATSATSSSKKRKTEPEMKYYAVKAGFKPGVYEDYALCQKQVAGFKGALFKSFKTKEDARAYIAGKEVTSHSDGPEKFYAVAVGEPTGIFSSWAEAQPAVTGVKGPKYKKFNTREEAIAYIKQFGNQETIQALGESTRVVQQPPKKAKPTTTPAVKQPPPDDGVLVIYTDGSSLANGRQGARAGVGVYFGDGDHRNVSERLEGELQTNQRAELTAILRAVEIAPLEQTIKIFTDSQYSINCVTQWAIGWRSKGWKTANNADVKNKDIIQAVLDRIEERDKTGSNTFFQWVKGHAADVRNQAADRLAVNGARLN